MKLDSNKVNSIQALLWTLVEWVDQKTCEGLISCLGTDMFTKEIQIIMISGFDRTILGRISEQFRGVEVTKNDRETLSELVKTIYVSFYNNQHIFSSRSYLEREKANYRGMLMGVKEQALITQLKGGKNNFQDFEKDLRQYSENFKVIIEFINTDTGVLEEAIKQREKDALELIDKYQGIFKISPLELMSVHERDNLKRLVS